MNHKEKFDQLVKEVKLELVKDLKYRLNTRHFLYGVPITPLVAVHIGLLILLVVFLLFVPRYLSEYFERWLINRPRTSPLR